jgi:hypothetical protein
LYVDNIIQSIVVASHENDPHESADEGVEYERAVETMALLHVLASEEEKWLKSWNRAGWVK